MPHSVSFANFFLSWKQFLRVFADSFVVVIKCKLTPQNVKNQGRGRGTVAPLPPATNGYDNQDTPNQLPPFTPRRPAGLHLEVPLLRGAMSQALDFFKPFFTVEHVD